VERVDLGVPCALMPKNPLFSTYRQGENRVTSSMLAVFERIDLSVLETLLTAATGEASLQTVTFVNQPVGKGASVPDARISAHFAYWFEVKTVPNALGVGQLEEHLKSLEPGASSERLFVITPDSGEPPAVAELGNPRVVWFNFRALYDAVDALLADVAGLVSEHARFLLRELQALLVEDGLVDNDDVVVVAARVAYAEYLEHHVYVCQPNRAFRDGLTHLGFYTDGAIQPHLPRIVHRARAVPFTTEEANRRRDADDEPRVADAIDKLLSIGARTDGNEYGVFILTPPGDPLTVHLDAPIVNDTVAVSGRPWAWTLGQRYTNLTRLTRSGVTRTSDLDRP
jgi:hypothetical protein